MLPAGDARRKTKASWFVRHRLMQLSAFDLRNVITAGPNYREYVGGRLGTKVSRSHPSAVSDIRLAVDEEGDLTGRAVVATGTSAKGPVVGGRQVEQMSKGNVDGRSSYTPRIACWDPTAITSPIRAPMLFFIITLRLDKFNN